MSGINKIGIIGAGAWGTALAWSVASNGTNVKLWSIEEDVVDSINNQRENSTYMPDIALPENIEATTDMGEAVDGMELLLFVTPSQFMRSALTDLAEVIPPAAVLVSATKGIENDTLAMPMDMISDTMPDSIVAKCAFLSGPTFARELAQQVPTAATVASKNHTSIVLAQNVLSTPYLRLYANSDVVGTELGGAVKNVIAIAAGISDGLGFGHNTRAAIITRGLAEMTRLGVAMGGDAQTFNGLSGIGDLLLTCAGDLSRNRTVGLRLGKGESLDTIIGTTNSIAEGVTTSLSLHNMAAQHDVDMPISEEVYKTLYKKKDPKSAVSDLMSRELKEEFITTG